MNGRISRSNRLGTLLKRPCLCGEVGLGKRKGRDDPASWKMVGVHGLEPWTQ